MGEGTGGGGEAPGNQGGTTGEQSGGSGSQGSSGNPGGGAGGNADGTGGNPGGADEDHLDRELRAIIEGAAGQARFREPTAEERGRLAQQARKKREADARELAGLQKETRKQSRKLQKNALKEQRGPGRRRRLGRAAWGVSAALLLGAGVFAYARFGHLASGPAGANDARIPGNNALPAATKPLSPLTESGPPADPFQGTPADKWADGTAGIVVPAATPTGRYPASQVERAYRTTKKLLVAAALDRQTLDGGAPAAFASLLTQDQRSRFLSGLNKTGLDKYGDTLSSRGWIIQFAPGTTRLIGSAIKVRGTMSAVATKDSTGNPVLRIKVNYLVAYAVEPPRAPADWMRVVSQFYGSVDFGNWRDADTPFEPWWNAYPATAGALCGTRDGFAHPDYPNGTPESVAPSGPLRNPYSSAPPGTASGCWQTTGT